jgi:2-polyprenyl-6-methoxyphenol hydroxylase-like FAD-dependent oxidoreductase
MAASPEDFSKALTDATAGVRGQLTLVSERRVFPLRRATAAQYVAGRCVLVGDAAHVIHPLAGQGVNQGLQDAIALVTALTGRPRGESVGASAALRRYERERRIGNSVMAAMVNGLDAAFTGSGGVRAWLAREAMAQVSRHSLAREFFFTRAAAGRSLPRR